MTLPVYNGSCYIYSTKISGSFGDISLKGLPSSLLMRGKIWDSICNDTSGGMYPVVFSQRAGPFTSNVLSYGSTPKAHYVYFEISTDGTDFWIYPQVCPSPTNPDSANYPSNPNIGGVASIHFDYYDPFILIGGLVDIEMNWENVNKAFWDRDDLGYISKPTALKDDTEAPKPNPALFHNDPQAYFKISPPYGVSPKINQYSTYQLNHTYAQNDYVVCNDSNHSSWQYIEFYDADDNPVYRMYKAKQATSHPDRYPWTLWQDENGDPIDNADWQWVPPILEQRVFADIVQSYDDEGADDGSDVFYRMYEKTNTYTTGFISESEQDSFICQMALADTYTTITTDSCYTVQGSSAAHTRIFYDDAANFTVGKHVYLPQPGRAGYYEILAIGTAAFDGWVNNISYDSGDYKIYGGHIYKSRTGSNLNHTPYDDDNTYWKLISKTLNYFEIDKTYSEYEFDGEIWYILYDEVAWTADPCKDLEFVAQARDSASPTNNLTKIELRNYKKPAMPENWPYKVWMNATQNV